MRITIFCKNYSPTKNMYTQSIKINTAYMALGYLVCSIILQMCCAGIIQYESYTKDFNFAY